MTNISRIFRAFFFSIITAIGVITVFPQQAVAQWTDLGRENGIQVYRDERTGLEWTQTIGQVQSSGWGAPARAMVARYGFRLPSFHELQVMEANGGFRRLNINTRAQQYYETSNSNTLAAAWGNGFRTPQQRRGTGQNWVIGVRDYVIVEGGNFGQSVTPVSPSVTVTNPPTGQSRPIVTSGPSGSGASGTQQTPSNPSVNVVGRPNVRATPSGSTPNTPSVSTPAASTPTTSTPTVSTPAVSPSTPAGGKPVLPGLPDYD